MTFCIVKPVSNLVKLLNIGELCGWVFALIISKVDRYKDNIESIKEGRALALVYTKVG